ncbi:MAG: polysaccharide deacetylase family protein [Spirochaetales bacterium]|nr:polysaccharide deacetylase family protein [Spirochaetales bacterium]
MLALAVSRGILFYNGREMVYTPSMICLTGDIHHSSLKINEQSFIPDPEDTEIKIAARYLRIVEQFGLKVTFYVTGKTLEEEWRDLEPVVRSPLVEIGGHTYGGLPRSFLSRMRSRISGTPTVSHAANHGSCRRQMRDTRRMVDIVAARTGSKIVSWRSHGLVVDRHTYPILLRSGIRFISDELSWDKLRPEVTPEGLISHPINVIMDHDHIYHAHRTRAYVQRQKKNWGFPADPTRESYPIERWADIVEDQVRKIERAGGVATILMHPLCMYTADRFATARRLFEVFSRYHSIWARETELYLED